MDDGNYLRHLRWVKPLMTNKRPNKNPLPVLGEGGYIRSNRLFQPGGQRLVVASFLDSSLAACKTTEVVEAGSSDFALTSYLH